MNKKDTNSYIESINPYSRPNRKPDVKLRRAVATYGGILTLTAAGVGLAVAGHKSPNAEVTLGYHGSADEYNAAKEIATVEGKNPDNRTVVGDIDMQVSSAFGGNVVVQDGQTVDMNIPVSKEYEDKTTASGFGTTIHIHK
jgi:hypothetical protein